MSFEPSNAGEGDDVNADSAAAADDDDDDDADDDDDDDDDADDDDDNNDDDNDGGGGGGIVDGIVDGAGVGKESTSGDSGRAARTRPNKQSQV